MNEYDRQLERFSFLRNAALATAIGGVAAGDVLLTAGNITSNNALEVTGAVGIIAAVTAFVLETCFNRKPIAPQYPESY